MNRKERRKQQRKLPKTFINYNVPKGFKSKNYELNDGEETLKLFTKYQFNLVSVDEHFNQSIRYSYYSVDDDYHYTIPYDNSVEVYGKKHLIINEDEFVKKISNKGTTTIHQMISDLKRQEFSNVKVDENLIFSMDVFLSLYTKHIIVPSLKKMFSKNPSLIHPPQSMFKNGDRSSSDIVIKLFKVGNGVQLKVDGKQFEVGNNPNGRYIKSVISDSTLSSEERNHTLQKVS